MAEKRWEAIRVQYCDNVHCDVALEAEVVYPAEFLPEQAPQILAHRCSKGEECGRLDRKTCQWAGTNPGFDPFQV